MMWRVAVADKQVRRCSAQTKTNLSAAISAGWSRCANAIGRGTFTDKADCDPVTLRRGIAGPSLPAAEHLLNSLAADPTALNEALALYGLIAIPNDVQEANDMALVTGLSGAVAEYLKRIADNKRCHVDEAVLATMFRPLIPQMQAIVEADNARRMP